MNISKISVIIPVYNAEKYLADVLEDLIIQTYSNLQIIVVDDGSTDKSRDIIKRFRLKDKRICLVNSNNKGPSSARNLGLEHADGEFIRFIDADDRIPSNSMKNLLLPYMEDEQIDLVIGNYVCLEEKNYYTGDFSKSGKRNDKEFAQMFVSHVKAFYFGVPWNKLYRKDIIDAYHIRFDEKLFWCEDFIFNIEYYRYCKNYYILNIKNGIYEYCVRESGITEKISLWAREELQRIDDFRYEKALQYFSEFGLSDACYLEWRYSGLYYKLSKLANGKEHGLEKERYQDFLALLSSEEIYRYICIMQNDSHLLIWKFLKWVVEKKQYQLAFKVFSIKEQVAEWIKDKVPFLKEKIKNIIPKFL